MARKARAKTTRRARPAWIESFSFRAAGAMTFALLGLGATGYGIAVVHARASDLLSTRPVIVEVAWPKLPGATDTWLGESLREQIVARVEAMLTGVPLDAVSLSRVGESLAVSGWFDQPPRVQRTADGTVGIRAVWRVPACALRSGARDYAIDWKGRPFPVDYPAGGSGMPVIVGAAAGFPAGGLDVMNPWPGDDVAAGLELLAPLLREPFAPQVAGVDVSAYFTHGQLAIVTDAGTRVVWGGRFGEFIPGEASSEEKLARLRSLAANPQFGGRIDMQQNRLEIFDERYFALDLTN